jgi:hypothetical protein
VLPLSWSVMVVADIVDACMDSQACGYQGFH